MIQLIQEIILLGGTTLSAITDAKTGYIYDWITIPMLLIGIILAIIQQQWNNIIIGVIIFGILYIPYRLGKLGGGDVKLYTAIALLNPQNNITFLLTAIFFASIGAMIFYPTYYTIKYAKIGINIEENKTGIKKAIVLGGLTGIYFYILNSMNLISNTTISLIGVPILFGLIFIALQQGITRNFFEKKIAVKNLEEDEVLAENKNQEKIMKMLNGNKLIGEKEKKILEKNGVKSICVLRNLPPFGPFILIGVIAAILQPQFIMFLYL